MVGQHSWRTIFGVGWVAVIRSGIYNTPYAGTSTPLVNATPCPPELYRLKSLSLNCVIFLATPPRCLPVNARAFGTSACSLPKKPFGPVPVPQPEHLATSYRIDNHAIQVCPGNLRRTYCGRSRCPRPETGRCAAVCFSSSLHQTRSAARSRQDHVRRRSRRHEG